MNGNNPLEEVLNVHGTRPKHVEAADTTIPTPPKPLVPDANPLEMQLDSASANPLEQALESGGISPEDSLRRAQTQYQMMQSVTPPPPTFAERHPFIQAFVVDQIHDVATALKWTLIQSPGGMGSAMGQANLQKYLLSLPPEQAQEETGRALRGGAFIASFAGAELVGVGAELARPALVKALPSLFLGRGGETAAGILLGKWGSFWSGEMLGGSIYGSMRPLAEDESRLHAVLGDAAAFAFLGTGSKLVGAMAGRAIKRFIKKMPPAERDATLNAVSEGTDKLNRDLAHGEVTLDQLPPEHAAVLEASVLQNAVKKVKPEVDLEAVIAKEAASTEPIAETFDRDFTASVEKARAKRVARLEARRESARARRAARRAAEPAATAEPEVQQTVPTMTVRALEEEKPTPAQGWSLGAAKPFEDIGERTSYQGAVYPILQDGKEVGYVDAAFDKSRPDELVVSWIGPNKKLGEPIGSLSVGYKNIRAFMSQVVKDFPEARRIVGERGGRRAKVAGAGLAEIPVPEHIIGPTVRGHSGRLFTDGTTHPEIIANAVDKGIPASEFEGIHAQHPGRGFRTNHQEFIARDEAAQLVGQADPLFSEDLHAARATPYQSPVVAGIQAETIAQHAIEASPDAKPIVEAAVMDAAVDDAVARMNPIDMASEGVKESAETVTRLANHAAETPTDISSTIEKALIRGEDTGAAEREIVTALTDPRPAEVAAEKASGTPHERVRRGKRRKSTTDYQPGRSGMELKRKAKAPIEVTTGEQINAPDMEPAVNDNLTVPKQMNGMEIASHLEDSELNKLSDTFLRIARDKGGFISARMLMFGTGGLMNTVAWADDNLEDWQKYSLWAVGSFMMLSALHPRLKEWAETNKFTRKIISLHSPTQLMTSTDAAEFQKLRQAIASSDLLAKSHEVAINKLFPDVDSQRALMYVIDEGTNAPELNLLTTSQQQAALSLNQMYARLSLWSRGSMMVKSRFEESYVRYVLPAETYQRWRSHGYYVNAEGKRARITALRELQAFAKREGLPEPLADAARLHAEHLKETYHAIAANNLGQALKEKGVITDIPAVATLPDGWRQITARGFEKKMAPVEIAQAIENLSNPALSEKQWLNSLDAIKGVFMRTIMLFPWEHGLNGLRAMVVGASSPRGFIRAMKAIRDLDPGLVEATRDGALNLFDRPDFGPQAHQAWQSLLSKTKLPMLGSLGAKIDAQMYRWEKLLWDNWVPTAQYFLYSNRMLAWAERTGGKFGKDTAEYRAAAQAAGEYANTVMGKLPGYLTDPALARGMRLLMFSPKWTTTRIGLIAHASGELSDMMEGKLNGRDPVYLKLKLRQVALTIGLTYGLSKLMSGEDPQFNPNTDKFYARTGMKNAKGQEMGLDLTGWWQQDLKMFNHPMNFIAGRLNPVLNVAAETITGRDYLGREMTPGQSIENIIGSFGPLAQIPEAIGRVAGGLPMTSGEALKIGSGMAATGNVATLPTPADVAISRFAKKLLVQQGLVATSDNVFQLSKILRANILYGQDVVDGQVINYLAYQRRNEGMRSGIGTAIDHLWQHARAVVGNLF